MAQSKYWSFPMNSMVDLSSSWTVAVYQWCFSGNYPLVNKYRPWKSPIFYGFTSLPTPMTARVYVNLPEGIPYLSQKTSQWTDISGFPVDATKPAIATPDALAELQKRFEHRTELLKSLERAKQWESLPDNTGIYWEYHDVLLQTWDFAPRMRMSYFFSEFPKHDGCLSHPLHTTRWWSKGPTGRSLPISGATLRCHQTWPRDRSVDFAATFDLWRGSIHLQMGGFGEMPVFLVSKGSFFLLSKGEMPWNAMKCHEMPWNASFFGTNHPQHGWWIAIHQPFFILFLLNSLALHQEDMGRSDASRSRSCGIWCWKRVCGWPSGNTMAHSGWTWAGKNTDVFATGIPWDVNPHNLGYNYTYIYIYIIKL